MVTPLNIHPDVARRSFVWSLIASSDVPLVLLDGNITVIVASDSFCRMFELEPSTVSGKRISDLGTGEWNVPQLISLLEATASGAAEVQAYELNFNHDGPNPRSLVLNARRINYEDSNQPRIVLTVADVTEARARDKLKDDLLKERAMLIQEVQHRVANSLQIIASIIMQSARRVQSDETRGYLKDTHGRLMSIAAVQKQLATSSQKEVELRSYFTQLCKSLGASMIPDHQVLSIEVQVDDSKVSANNSVSLGLIVTELVINALKHAFPENRNGRILVSYQSHGPNWKLSVSDDGVGMPAESTSPKAGLGTNIVEALAKSLNAEISVAKANPGTLISIAHARVAAVHAARIV